jgi:uncharacterized protein YkwD
MDSRKSYSYSLDTLQKTALSLMSVLVLVTFVGANLQSVLWQSSQWLVSTVLPATVVDLTNKERSGLQQVPLQRNATLDAAAKLKAAHMAREEYFSHFSPEGISPWHWFDEAGYVYAHAGENLAIHFTDSSEVVEAWMDSPTHRENIVNGQYTEIGVGTAKGSYEGYDTVYVVQLFGTPAVAPAQPPQAPVVSETTEPLVAQESVPVSSPGAIAGAAAPESSEPSELAVVSETETQTAQSPASTEVSVPNPNPNPTPNPAAPEPVPVPVQESEPPADSLVIEEQPPESVPETDTQVVFEPIATSNQEVVIIKSPVISTSSGLAVANITTDNPSHAGATSIASYATKPNALLQFVYLGLGLVVFLLLTASLVLEARQLRVVQVAYSVLLLVGMGGLWFLNSILTSGAVIV